MSAPPNTERPGSGAAGSGPGDGACVETHLPEAAALGEADSEAAGQADGQADGEADGEADGQADGEAAGQAAGQTAGQAERAPSPRVARHPAQRPRPLRTALLSAFAVLMMVTGGVLLVPRPNSTPLHLVDVTAAAAAARPRLGFVPAVPAGPAGWTVTSAQVRNGTDGILTWHVGLTTAQGTFAGFEQAVHSTFAWENALDSGGKHIGTVDVGGVVWDHLEKIERGTTTLILRRYGKVTVVTAHGGGLTDAMTLIRSLPPDALT